MARPPGAVLFACGLNRIRSPMAAGLLRRLHGAGVFVDSCGLRVDPEAAPDPFVAIVMDEIGIDMGDHAPKTFDDLIDESFDWIVSLSPEAHHRAVECAGGGAVKLEYWPTPDPTLATGAPVPTETVPAAATSPLDAYFDPARGDHLSAASASVAKTAQDAR
ncbi:MAG TPA: low molecular weight phosphatase family protein, partial [Caulobacteraceae bacterium]